MSARDHYQSRGRKTRIVFSWDQGLGSVQRVEVDGEGQVTALLVRVAGLPAKWTRRVGVRRVSEILDLFHEVDFFSLGEQPAPRVAQPNVRRELMLVVGGRNNRVCDGLPGPRAGTVLRPGRSLDRIYRALEALTLEAVTCR